MTDRIVTRVCLVFTHKVYGKDLNSMIRESKEKDLKEQKMLALGEIDETSALAEIEKRLTGSESEKDFKQAWEFFKERFVKVIRTDLNLDVLTTGMETHNDQDNTSNSEYSDAQEHLEVNVIEETSSENFEAESTGIICERCFLATEIQTQRNLIRNRHLICNGCFNYISSSPKDQRIIIL